MATLEGDINIAAHGLTKASVTQATGGARLVECRWDPLRIKGVRVIEEPTEAKGCTNNMYVGGESNDFRMMIDLPSFNVHLHMKDFSEIE